jgi:hypothetical protein
MGKYRDFSEMPADDLAAFVKAFDELVKKKGQKHSRNARASLALSSAQSENK